MHHYRVPDGTGSETELNKLRDLADAFNDAAIRAYQPKMEEIAQAMTPEEAGTMMGMTQLVRSQDGRDNPIELKITLQTLDLMAGVLDRVDPKLVQACVPADMAKADVADLFRKHDLPVFEGLARKASKPKTP